jgi:hypothetical protein
MVLFEDFEAPFQKLADISVLDRLHHSPSPWHAKKFEMGVKLAQVVRNWSSTDRPMVKRIQGAT